MLVDSRSRPVINISFILLSKAKIISEYDREIPQSQTADNPNNREEEPLNHHETPRRHIKQRNQLSRPIYLRMCTRIWRSVKCTKEEFSMMNSDFNPNTLNISQFKIISKFCDVKINCP